jgi:undecaprenyl-diphosphatase
MDSYLTAIILGIVEGLTEYLPVSSTGHLILATKLLGFDPARWEVFNIAIQPGAILAIVVLYWRTFWAVGLGLVKWEQNSVRFVRNVLIAFLPAAIVGFALKDYLSALLENAWVVAWALIVGGFAILLVEKFARPKEMHGVANVSFGTSILVGIVQCIAMIPGVSRSGATILGAMSFGVDRRTAAEFSFFLALPTLVGATALQLMKHRHEISSNDLGLIGIGALVSFVVALAVIKAFLAIVTKHGFAPFAWYRIVAGAAALVWLSIG